MKHCVVNFSNGLFKKGQVRLKNSLIENKYQGDVILFDDYCQIGSKSHQEVPYQFKVYAINEARKRGYDVVLYCDASIYAIKDVMPAFRFIEKNGCMLEYCGYNLGQFSTDLSLKVFGISRDDAMSIQLHSAGFTGIDFRNEKASLFFDEWLNYAKEEITFKGSWNNSDLSCSSDVRCLGHRHDQTVASFVANKIGLNRTNPLYMKYKYDNLITEPETIFLAQGII